MKKCILLSVFTLITCAISFSQCLVPNSSFEANSGCPQGGGDFLAAGPWVSEGTVASTGTAADYLHVCGSLSDPNATNLVAALPYGQSWALSLGTPIPPSSIQTAFSGDAMIRLGLHSSLNPNFREYIQVTLNAPLIAGQDYCFSMALMAPNHPFFVASAQESLTTGVIGAHFSSTPLLTGTNLPIVLTPTIQTTEFIDTLWQQVTYTFTATGGEQYLTIGNFLTDVTTAPLLTPHPRGTLVGVNGAFSYLFIDDLCIEPVLDPTITSTGPFCYVNTSPSVNLTATDPGGTWSGTGITNTATGIFDPSIAGPGSHTITYNTGTACNIQDAITILVDVCLPVELYEFNAQVSDNNAVLLNWATATELNNDYFDIEFSTDAQNFSKIGTVSGAGTTTKSQDYEFIDLNARNQDGLIYYRLKQVDFDGAYEYSNTASVSLKDASLAILHPNPTEGSKVDLTITNARKGEIFVEISDARGLNVLSKRFALSDGASTLSLDLENIAQGTYFVKILRDGVMEEVLPLIHR